MVELTIAFMILNKMKNKILVTCPPMIKRIDNYIELAKNLNILLYPAKIKQSLSEEELIKIIGNFDGWIIGDDIASKEVIRVGKYGRLKAAVKWGVGTDNINYEAFKDNDIKIANTPNMFGKEVADISIGYLIGLARHTYLIDSEIKKGKWPKITGSSLAGKKIGLIGYGDIGQETSKRLLIMGMKVIVYDPNINKEYNRDIDVEDWPNKIDEVDYLIINCSLTKTSYKMLNERIFKKMKKGVKIINVSRGLIINERDLINALEDGIVESVALDVFEEEPLTKESKLMKFNNCIFGSHNASNTEEAVDTTTRKTLYLMSDFLIDK